MHKTGIYEIRNVVNGKRYVGSAVDFGNRWRQHAQSLQRGDHHSRSLQRAWRKYSPHAFQFNRLMVCSKENLIMYEQAVMDALKPEYNCAPRAGSQLGLKMSAEAKAKMSAASARTRNFTGHTHSPESRSKISTNRKGKGGGPMGAERKRKISESQKGKVITAEQRAKISATLMGHKQSAEQIEKRMQKLRGRKMPPGFADAQRQRMLGSKKTASAIRNCGLARASLTEDQVRTIRTELVAGKSNKSLAVMYGVDPSVVSNIKHGKAYHWVV
jgi:group I intron endonuclease